MYRATHRNGMRVAVKVLHPELAEDPSVRRRFLREGYLANRIEHPGVVRILDDDEDDDGTAFIAMELLEGETLDAEWRRSAGRLPVARVVEVGRELLHVLVAAHGASVVHRDLKPENVFVTQGGQLKVFDFGLARLMDQPRTTPTGNALGTTEFMAPEQARGATEDVDARTDVYAVGAVMFTLLSGRYVHDTRNSLERMVTTATVRAPALRSAAPEVSEELGHVIDRALAFHREKRWPDAIAMCSALAEMGK